MPRPLFWQIIKDADKHTYEAMSRSTDDTALVNFVVNLQDMGMSVVCETIDGAKSLDDIRRSYGQIGYKEEPGLYNRLQLVQRKQR